MTHSTRRAFGLGIIAAASVLVPPVGVSAMQTVASDLPISKQPEFVSALEGALRWYMFEPNDAETRQRITTELYEVTRRFGIEMATVFCDETNNTPEMIERGEIFAAVFTIEGSTLYHNPLRLPGCQISFYDVSSKYPMQSYVADVGPAARETIHDTHRRSTRPRRRA